MRPEQVEARRALQLFVAVIVGVAAAACVAIIASDAAKSDAYAAVAGSVLSVVASLAGFYTGHRLGADGREKAENARTEAEDARRKSQRAASIYEAYMPEDARQRARQALARDDSTSA